MPSKPSHASRTDFAKSAVFAGLNEPPGAAISTSAVLMYGRTVRALRNFTKSALDKEPSWRRATPP